jgi:hypothetical protein
LDRHIAPLCAALLGTFLAGCATKTFDARAVQTASELTIALAVHHSGLVDRPFVATSTPLDSSGQYRLVSRWWCEPNAKASSVEAAKVEYSALCGRLGGSIQGDFCVKSGNADDVLFMAQIIRAPRPCANGTSVRVAEPTVDHGAPAYVSALRSSGFKTSEDRAADQAKAAQLARQLEKQIAVEVDRRAAMLPRMRQRGTRVCRVEGMNTFVGFVEDSTETKLQIRVANAYPTRVPGLQLGGFQPHITWDVPARWELCG